MPKLRFVKNYPEIELPQGTNLMQGLLKGGLPVASSCQGDGVCAKCRIQILQGIENLTPINERESILRSRFNLAKDWRISCQTQVLGDVVLDTPYW